MNSDRSRLEKSGVVLLWLALVVLLLPALGVLGFWMGLNFHPDSGLAPPFWLELLQWSPILAFVTTPAAVLAGVIGLVLKVVGKRRRMAAQ